VPLADSPAGWPSVPMASSGSIWKGSPAIISGRRPRHRPAVPTRRLASAILRRCQEVSGNEGAPHGLPVSRASEGSPGKLRRPQESGSGDAMPPPESAGLTAGAGAR
jgi:hypothetical protein